MKAFSKLWRCFREHIDEILIRVVLLLVALAVAVMLSESTANFLKELLGLNKKGKYEVLQTIGFCIVGVLLVLQALAANRRAKAMEDTAKAQAKATENTEVGQRQERLKNAIEHLGHDRDSVRMGGAHELFHLAKDTKDSRQTVLDFLCAHIRQTTTGQTTRGKDYQAEHKTKPSEEIQGLLTLLFVQEHDVFEDCSINLQGSYLNGANLIQARLKRANLRQAQLQGAYLNQAQMQKANLLNAQLQYAYIRDGQVQRANLWDAQLQRANLWGTHLQGTNLWGAQMQGAILVSAKMRGSILRDTKLQKAILSSAEFQGAILIGAKMQGSFLINTNFQGAILTGAKMQEADLGKTQLQGVNSIDVSPIPEDFESRIRDRVDMFSDLTGITFTGGLKEEDLDTLCEGLSDDQAQALRETLRPHVGQPASHELPEDSGTVTGAYTQEEAEQWIAEYNKAMQEMPRTGDS